MSSLVPGTAPWHRHSARGWDLDTVHPLRSLLLRGTGCLGEVARCLWDPARCPPAPLPAAGWEQRCAPSKGGVGLQAAFEQGGWRVCVLVLQKLRVSEAAHPKKTPCCQPSGCFLLGNLAVMKAELKGSVTI